MAIIGKLMGARPGMSAPKAAPKPAPVSSRPSLDFLTGGQPKQTIPADAFDRDALIQDILSKIQVPSAPVFDPTGLQARLAELESRQAPVFDPSALKKQIAELQNREAPVFDPSELQKQISDLRQRPSRDDFMSIERQLQDLRNRDIPQFDPSQLQAGIAGLQDRLANIPQFDPSALQQQIEANRSLLGNIPQFDDSALRERLKSLEGREIPQFDPSALQNRLAELEGRKAPTFNPEDFREQFLNIAREGIEIPQAPTIDREELVRDITGRIKQPRPFDPSSLQERLAALENRQPVPPPAFDTSAIDQRFEDITRQLAELQSAQEQPSPAPVVPPVQPLPIQPPGDLNFDIKEDAPDIRDLAKELPEGGTIFDQLQPPVTSVPLIGGITPPSISPEEQARRDEQKNLSSQISSATNDFYAAFPDAPQPPRVGTMDVRIFTDPITGEQKQGSSTDLRYRNSLKAFLDANPAAQASYNENVVTPQKRLIDLRGGPAQGPGLIVGGGRPVPPISIGGPGGGRTDPRMFPGGSPTFDERGETFVPPDVVGDTTGFGFSSINTGEPSPPPDPVVEPTPDPVATPTGEPAAPPPAPTIPTPPGSVDPVIMGQVADEKISDPLLRALYFGTPDQPGFFNQLQQVGANLLGAQAPGTEYDPSMTEKFFNPFEDQVVQQTVEDVLKAGEQRDIAARAQDIGRGGLSAFGSRARLTADERQEALGRGLGKALAGIRQSGFSEAQRTGLSEFDRQYGRDISQLYRPLDILRGIGGLLPGYQAAGTNLRTTYGMPSDPSALGLGAAIGAYTSLAPQTGSAFDSYGQTTGQG